MKTLSNLISVFKYINNHPLAGKHRVTAYSNFLRWQLGQLVMPSERVMPFVGPTFLSVSKGMTGATGNIYLGIHDFVEMSFLLHFLTKDDVFADVGANVGSYSILASGVNGARTIAFEPLLKTFSELEKKISINKLGNKVTPYNLALGAKVGKLNFTTALDTVNHVVADYEMKDIEERVEVNVETLDNIVKAVGAPALVKIDVEGFETEVLIGMDKTLQDETLKAIIIELNGSGLRYGYNENLIHEKLLLHGFKPYLYDPFNRLCELSSSYGDHNTLYLRDIDFVKERLTSAKKVNIFNESY